MDFLEEMGHSRCGSRWLLLFVSFSVQTPVKLMQLSFEEPRSMLLRMGSVHLRCKENYMPTSWKSP